MNWAITDEATLKQERINKFGQGEYDRRLAVVEEKRSEFPKSDWKERIVVGGQFDSIAFAVDQDAFDKLATKDYKFWAKIFYQMVH